MMVYGSGTPQHATMKSRPTRVHTCVHVYTQTHSVHTYIHTYTRLYLYFTRARPASRRQQDWWSRWQWGHQPYTHTDIHTHTDTHTQTDIHTHTDIHTRTDIHTQTDIHTHTDIHTRTDIHTHTDIHTRTDIHTHTDIHTQTDILQILLHVRQEKVSEELKQPVMSSQSCLSYCSAQ